MQNDHLDSTIAKGHHQVMLYMIANEQPSFP